MAPAVPLRVPFAWLAWLGTDGKVHLGRLGCNDKLIGKATSFTGIDLQDVQADDVSAICAACRVTAAVTNGLPSRSPPIHEPKVSGRAVGAVSTPSRRNVSARSSRTCGAASAYKSLR